MLRTMNCGEAREKHVNQKHTLTGWVDAKRDHGGVLFISLRDRYGVTQLVFNPDCKDFNTADELKREYVIKAEGTFRRRSEENYNSKLNTGYVELVVDNLEVLNKSEVPKISIDDRKKAGEDLRLEYRYLDLRRPSMTDNIVIKSKVKSIVRKFMDEKGFLDIETPFLVRSTPEGARDYVVPSRVKPGKIYSLPQSPQLYKQLLMISGFDKYYQIVKCMRDEDLRADRQPEFTQLDLEMSFVEQQDVISLMDDLIKEIWFEIKGYKPKIKTITFDEAMNKYGSDKPDTRFGMELVDVTKEINSAEFKALHGDTVKAVVCPYTLSRKECDRLIDFCKEQGAKGMAYMFMTENGLESNVAKHFSSEELKKLENVTKVKEGEILMFLSDKWMNACNYAGKLRSELNKRYGEKQEEDDVLWVIDFPLYEYDDELEQYVPMHHLFTKPKPETLKYLEKEPEKVIGYLYDLVINGVEMGSGSIRIEDSELQKKMFKVIGVTEKEMEEKFGFLMRALDYGAPPHGGIALGFDRLVAIIQGINDIREVIPFPRNKHAENPLDGSPSPWEEQQLKELMLKNDIKKSSK